MFQAGSGGSGERERRAEERSERERESDRERQGAAERWMHGGGMERVWGKSERERKGGKRQREGVFSRQRKSGGCPHPPLQAPASGCRRLCMHLSRCRSLHPDSSWQGESGHPQLPVVSRPVHGRSKTGEIRRSNPSRLLFLTGEIPPCKGSPRISRPGNSSRYASSHLVKRRTCASPAQYGRAVLGGLRVAKSLHQSPRRMNTISYDITLTM